MADIPISKRSSADQPKRSLGSTPRFAGRPAALPNARALLGALLTVGAALLAWFAATNGGETPRRAVVVAARDIAAGAVLNAEDLQVVRLAMPEQLSSRVFTGPTPILGTISLGPIGAGDPVLLSMLAPSSALGTAREISITLPVASAVGGNLRSGDTVDVIAVHDGSGTDARAETIASKLLVSRISGDNPKLTSPTGDRIVTFAVDSNLDVEKLLLAADTAKVHLVRTTGASTKGTSPNPPVAPIGPTTSTATPVAP